jgi:tetratricopeptide (TPR) repeat protein
VACLPFPLFAAQTPASDEALARLRSAHRARPADTRTALELGLQLYQKDNAGREARGLLEEAALRFPERRDVQLALLDAYLAAGDSAAAEALLRRLAPELEADERFSLDAAYCLVRRGRLPEARTQANRVASRVQDSVRKASGQTLTPDAQADLHRRVAEVWFVQGLLTAHLGRKEEALRLLRDADRYEFPPLDSPLMVLAAECLSDLQEHALAAQAYREVVSRAPENVPARLRLAISLFSSGQLTAAKEELEQVLRSAPDSPRANYYLGATLFEEKRTEAAQAHLEKELVLDPRCSECMAKLAHISYLSGDGRQCAAWLARATALDPASLEASLVSGMLEIQNGQYEQAIQHLSRVVAQLPGYAKAQYQLALAYQRSGNAPKAQEHRQTYDRLIQEQKARSLGVRGSE